MSDSPSEVTRSPLLGEHTDEILRQVLGFTDHQVAEIHDSGALEPRKAGGGVSDVIRKARKATLSGGLFAGARGSHQIGYGGQSLHLPPGELASKMRYRHPPAESGHRSWHASSTDGLHFAHERHNLGRG
jgi:hypothetical protein